MLSYASESARRRDPPVQLNEQGQPRDVPETTRLSRRPPAVSPRRMPGSWSCTGTDRLAVSGEQVVELVAPRPRRLVCTLGGRCGRVSGGGGGGGGAFRPMRCRTSGPARVQLVKPGVYVAMPPGAAGPGGDQGPRAPHLPDGRVMPPNLRSDPTGEGGTCTLAPWLRRDRRDVVLPIAATGSEKKNRKKKKTKKKRALVRQPAHGALLGYSSTSCKRSPLSTSFPSNARS